MEGLKGNQLILNTNLAFTSRSKATCDGKKHNGPKNQDCLETINTLHKTKLACHGDYQCQVGADLGANLLEKAACKPLVKELSVKYICGKCCQQGFLLNCAPSHMLSLV